MTQVPLKKDHNKDIDDAEYFDRATRAYKQYFSGLFTGSWPEAFERYKDDQTTINLFEGEMDAPDMAVVLVRDYEAGLDDGHYLNFALTTFADHFSHEFNEAWEEAYQTLLHDRTPIDLVEGEVVPSEHPAQLPDIDIDDLPEPTQLPADDDRPEPTQY